MLWGLFSDSGYGHDAGPTPVRGGATGRGHERRMKRLFLPILLTGLFLSALSLRAGTEGNLVDRAAPAAEGEDIRLTPPAPMTYQEQNDAVFQYCYRCHNDELRRGELSLESFDAARAADNAELAEKMVRKLRAGMMPPKSSRQPDAATRAALVTALETTLDAAAAANPNPGRRSFQRLNRAEYVAAVRALFGLDVDVSTYLPADTISASFDNIADVQMPSATVMQGYMRAASYVSRVAVGDPSADPGSTTYDIPRTQSQKERVDGAPFGTRGGTSVVHNFPADGKYKFQMLLHGEPTGALFGRTIGDIQLEVSIDGERVALVKVDRWISESDPDGLAVTTEPIDVRAGPRRVAAAFLQEFEGIEDDLMKPIDHTLADTQIGVGYGVTTLPHLRNFAIVGPFEVTGISDNPTRRAIFSCRPTAPEESEPCARRIIETLAAKAYRRPLAPGDLDELMPFYTQGAAAGGFEGGIRTALQAMLSSLHFIFRVEETPENVKGGAIYRINDVDLASRLSFFLWGTIPDKALVDLARARELSNPAVFEAQVRRMLDDPRSEALATRFAAQWLRLQDLHKIEPDALAYPYFDETLAEAMYRETELFFDSLVRDDRPVLDVLTADYTFVNERLARHYGISGVSGREFRRVAYPDDTRRGVLGHAQHPHADLARQPHVAGAARQVGARSPARQPATAAAAERARPRADRRCHRRPVPLGGRAARDAPGQPGVQLVSQRHRPDWPVARQLRRDRVAAHQGPGRACQYRRRAVRRHAAHGRGRPARRARRAVRRGDDALHRDADVLRPGPAGRVLRHADGPADCARGRG